MRICGCDGAAAAAANLFLELSIPKKEGGFKYFGNAKDLPLILKEYESSYQVHSFPGTTNQSETDSIVYTHLLV